MSINKIHKPTSLDELLSYQGEEFLHVAYRSLLQRNVDQEGLKYYLDRLRIGTSKIEILGQIRNSEEGKLHQSNIENLDEVLKRYRQLKTPLLGSILRIAGVKQIISNIKKPSKKSVAEQHSSSLTSLEKCGLDHSDLPFALNVKQINDLNPHEDFENLEQAFALLTKFPVSKLKFFNEAVKNADLYTKIALYYESVNKVSEAVEIYRASLLFENTPTAHEYLGNFASRDGKHYLAVAHYKRALELGSKSPWLYLNLATSLVSVGQQAQAIGTMCAGIDANLTSELLLSRFDEFIQKYWDSQEQIIESHASAQDRKTVISLYELTASFVSKAYCQVFTRNSQKRITPTLNTNRVLIIGLSKDVLPQCYRYRIEQKLEQLAHVGYEAEEVLWTDAESAFNKINFNDLIIFYRVPSFPSMLKLAEYAKSLGKITFYELDDLLFEDFSVPGFETYGGQLSLSLYLNVTKDIGLCRAMARRCEYAISSTLPLVERLAPLTLSKIGFLHRNGLDKHNRMNGCIAGNKGYLNLFYGSATLAHNSDFVIEALPAIARILHDYQNVKLTIVGNLTLPQSFATRFKKSIIQVPIVKDIQAYWAYLSASDINLAVLSDNLVNGCKSELKWVEAATFCIPSVVSQTKNYLDVVRQGEDGFVVSGVDQWYEALKKLIESSDLRSSVGRHANERVCAEYSIDSLSENIDLLLKQAISTFKEKINPHYN